MSSNKWTRYASAASCIACKAVDCHLNPPGCPTNPWTNSAEISRTWNQHPYYNSMFVYQSWKGEFSNQSFCTLLISSNFHNSSCTRSISSCFPLWNRITSYNVNKRLMRGDYVGRRWLKDVVVHLIVPLRVERHLLRLRDFLHHQRLVTDEVLIPKRKHCVEVETLNEVKSRQRETRRRDVKWLAEMKVMGMSRRKAIQSVLKYSKQKYQQRTKTD